MTLQRVERLELTGSRCVQVFSLLEQAAWPEAGATVRDFVGWGGGEGVW